MTNNEQAQHQRLPEEEEEALCTLGNVTSTTHPTESGVALHGDNLAEESAYVEMHAPRSAIIEKWINWNSLVSPSLHAIADIENSTDCYVSLSEFSTQSEYSCAPSLPPRNVVRSATRKESVVHYPIILKSSRFSGYCYGFWILALVVVLLVSATVTFVTLQRLSQQPVSHDEERFAFCLIDDWFSGIVLIWKDISNYRLITSSPNGLILKHPPAIPVPPLFLFLVRNKTVCGDHSLDVNSQNVSQLRELNLPNGRIPVIGEITLKTRNQHDREIIEELDNYYINATGYGTIDEPFINAVDYPDGLILDGSALLVASAYGNGNRYNYVVHVCYNLTVVKF